MNHLEYRIGDEEIRAEWMRYYVRSEPLRYSDFKSDAPVAVFARVGIALRAHWRGHLIEGKSDEYNEEEARKQFEATLQKLYEENK